MEDRELKLPSGWLGVALLLAVAGAIAFLIHEGTGYYGKWPVWIPLAIGCLSILEFFLCFGFIINGPNQTRVIQLFGKYVGTVRATGFFYGNPLYYRTRVSLRVRTFETGVATTDEIKDPATGKVISAAQHKRQPSKVNDRDGTPIEIAAVVVWKVITPTDAVFHVDDYESFVKIQSESALRNLASQYPYDGDGVERSLRANTADVGKQLASELHDRLHQAGVEVIEARISYLAYASEIASAMLQRQQAGALIAARRLIVDAAVGMVEHAIDELSKRSVVDLDAERKAAMVNNLMVVLCGHGHSQAVINTGTLHN